MLLVTRRQKDELLRFVERKPFSYELALLEGDASFSGLWVYRDDLTDLRVLGAIARVDPQVVGIQAVEDYSKSLKGEKAKSARVAYESVRIFGVTPSDGIEWPHVAPRLPSWREMEEGLVVPAVRRAYARGPRGQSRSTIYKRGTTRSMRPVVRFDLCTKCTLCWLECPDECFDPTPDGLYDVNYDYCTGCGKCAQVCPVGGCIVMADELKFENNESPWESYGRNPAEYIRWVEGKRGDEIVLPNVITGGVSTKTAGGSGERS